MKKTLLIALIFVFVSCKKETITQYEVEPVHLKQSGNKSNLKSDLQFVSIAYSDLFGVQISANDLNVILAGYNSVGDKSLIIDRIIRKLLSAGGIDKPTDADMRANLDAFIEACFERFFVRKATEMETWFFKSKIEANPQLKPEDIYYVLMSSNEYRYY